MQLFISLFYLGVYLITFASMWLYIYNFLPILFIVNKNFIILLSMIRYYYAHTFFFWGFLLSLSGLPPFANFFIKFTAITLSHTHWDSFFIIFILLYIYISMIYYLQFFKVRTTRHLFYKQLCFNVLQKKELSGLQMKNLGISTLAHYNLLYFLSMVFLINSCFIFIYTDCVLIIYNLVS